MRRPLADAKVPEWRRYADFLEERIAGLLRDSGVTLRDSGVTLWGIPIIEDASIPPGRAELRWRGTTCAQIIGLDVLGHEPMPDLSDQAVQRRIMPDAEQLLRALHKARLEYLSPDEIRIHLVPKEGDE